MGPAYVYLLGTYLGDGTLTFVGPKRMWRLRVFQDARYTDLIKRCQSAIWVVANMASGKITRGGCTEIYSNWKHWICMFPQHGPGRKHERAIKLESWQVSLVERYPHEFVKGLIHSDGCRCVNRVRNRRYEYVRYFFSNHSAAIRQLFIDTCALIGVEARPNNRYSISVAKRESVAILESFVGAKS